MLFPARFHRSMRLLWCAALLGVVLWGTHRLVHADPFEHRDYCPLCQLTVTTGGAGGALDEPPTPLLLTLALVDATTSDMLPERPARRADWLARDAVRGPPVVLS